MSAKGGGTDGWTNGRTYVRTDKFFSYSTGLCPLLDLLSKKSMTREPLTPCWLFLCQLGFFFLGIITFFQFGRSIIYLQIMGL